MEEEKHCIYRHVKPCGEVFYIGKSKNKYRPLDKTKRSIFWKRVVEKHPDFKIEIIASNIHGEDIDELEEFLISIYGRRDLGTGTLVNLTDGGEGAKNVSEETLDKRRGENNFMYGKTHTPESIAIIVENTSRKTICTKTLVIYKSVKFAAQENDLSYDYLVKMLRGRYRNTTSFAYYDDYINNTIPEVRPLKKSLKVIDTKTGIIYQSPKEAARKLNLQYVPLLNKLKGDILNKTGLVYLKDYEEGITRTPNLKKDYSTEVIDKVTKKIYNSISESARSIGMNICTLRNQLNGTYKNKTTLVYLRDYEDTSG